MQILVLGGDGYLGWPTALHLSALGHEVAVNDNFARRQYDEEMGVESLVPIATLEERVAAWAEVGGKTIKSYVGDLCDAGVRARDGRRFPPRDDRPLRRAARGAVLDDRSGALRLHADQQHRRQPQRDVRDRRHRPRHPSRQARDDGRVRHAQHRHRGGVARGRAQRAQGPRAVPEAARLLLPPLEGPRQPQHRVRLPDLGAARHRPQPGGRVRRRHRADQARPAAGHALRLRRRVRHGAEPDGYPGGARPPADGLRQRLADARPDQHRRHRRMHSARLGESRGARRVPRVQPVHRASFGAPDRRHDRRGVSGRVHDRARSRTRASRPRTTTTTPSTRRSWTWG